MEDLYKILLQLCFMVFQIGPQIQWVAAGEIWNEPYYKG